MFKTVQLLQNEFKKRHDYRKPFHFLSLKDFTAFEIELMVRRSLELKQIVHSERASGLPSPLIDQCVKGRSLAMIFTKRSTRTRVSSETGLILLTVRFSSS
jgi:ornithine carbamoyltransferase